MVDSTNVCIEKYVEIVEIITDNLYKSKEETKFLKNISKKY